METVKDICRRNMPLSALESGVAVGWRNRENNEVDLTPACKKHDIGLYPQGTKRLHAAENRVELMESTSIDDLVIATGPDEAEVRQHGPTRPHGAPAYRHTVSQSGLAKLFRLFSK